MEDLLGGYTSLIDETSAISNAEKPLLLDEKNSGSSDKMQLAKLFPDKAEPLISKDQSSGAEEMLSAKLVSRHDAKESSGTSLKQESTVASSNQGIVPEGQNNLLETANCKEAFEPVLKCK